MRGATAGNIRGVKDRRYWLGMRWWLALAFALVAAVTAIAVVRVTASRSEDAFRHYAEEFALGNSFAAAVRIGAIEDPRALHSAVAEIARNRRVSLYLFDEQGRLVTPAESRGVAFSNLPHGDEALGAALAGRRFVGGSEDGATTVVGLPFRSGEFAALIAYSVRPEVRDQLGIVRTESGQAALWAILVGAAAGLLLAAFIGRRLRRIADTARAIEGGDFSRAVADPFPDEVGSLADSINRMRLRLNALVTTLREDRDRLERLVERLNECVLLVDPELRVEFANASAAEIISGVKEGQPLDEASAGPEILGFSRLLLAEREPPEPIYVTADNRTLLVSGVPARGPGDAAILVVADVTQRERAERAQREFVTNAAHELRTPVAGIVTSIEMLQTGAKDDPDYRDEFLRNIEREAARLARLTRSLLVLARAEAREEEVRHEQVPLLTLLDRVASDLEPRPPVQVAVQCDPDLTVYTNSELLEQALQSVTQNAETHTERGSIVIRGRRFDSDHVAVEVIDTGAGINGADRRRLFDRFYRGNDAGGGFGLGLAIAAQAVRAIGGSIDIRDNDGDEAGTTVEVLLPVGTEKA